MTKDSKNTEMKSRRRPSSSSWRVNETAPFVSPLWMSRGQKEISNTFSTIIIIFDYYLEKDSNTFFNNYFSFLITVFLEYNTVANSSVGLFCNSSVNSLSDKYTYFSSILQRLRKILRHTTTRYARIFNSMIIACSLLRSLNREERLVFLRAIFEIFIFTWFTKQ